MNNTISPVQASPTVHNSAPYNPPVMPNTATHAVSKNDNHSQTIKEIEDSGKFKNVMDNTESYTEKDIYYEYKNGTLTIISETSRSIRITA